jgi:hypothetical protein
MAHPALECVPPSSESMCKCAVAPLADSILMAANTIMTNGFLPKDGFERDRLLLPAK